jgi:hypothetical protein
MTAISRLRRAKPEAATQDPETLHRKLAWWNHRRLSPGFPTDRWAEAIACEQSMLLLEGQWVEGFRQEVKAECADAPTDPDGFIAWFEDLKASGPGQGDALFPWLANDATIDEMRWFLRQEAAGEAGFDDLVAMCQVKIPDEAKLELARNYWDEMGRGNLGGMHGPMLGRTVEDLDLNPMIDETVWESLALANTMTAFSTTRRYAYHAIGALGVVELTAPGRVAEVAKGLKRLGAPPSARKYFDLHAILDIQHSKDWNENALRPLVRDNPGCARYLAEGALMRLKSGERCFETYRAHLWGAGARLAAE